MSSTRRQFVRSIFAGAAVFTFDQLVSGAPLGVQFVNVAREAGLRARTIFGGEKKNKYLLETTGCGVAFFDYDNDGWLDIFLVNGTRFETAWPAGEAPVSRLYKNNRDGTFTDITVKAGLVKTGWGQGVCAGDYDNDGWDDLYVSTGAADYRALMPNRMFRNAAGGAFQDVTTAAGVGHLQKGGGVSFGDVDGDGDLDLYVVVGGEFPGDGFLDALFINPGNGNHWVTLRLAGVRSNRSAIGARLALRLRTAEGTREIHRVVGSGGSFGASTLQQEIGLGQATSIERATVRWPSGATEEFTELPMDAVLALREGAGRADRVSGR